MIFERARLIFTKSQTCFMLIKGYYKQPNIKFQKRMISKKTPDEPLRTMEELKEFLRKKAAIYRKTIGDYSLEKILSLLPDKQDDMSPRRMEDSWDRVIIPLGTNCQLRYQYLALDGGLRIGRLLEDLDYFSGWITFKHILNHNNSDDLPPPMGIATALVDHINFQDCVEISPNQDIKLEGHVSWVGTSSVEISVTVFQFKNGEWLKVTEAVFCNVARNPLLNVATPINPLICDSEREKELFKAGDLRKMKRLNKEKNALFISPPNEAEKNLVHELLMKMADPVQHSFSLKNKPINSKWMEDAKLKTVLLCFSESRNFAGKVFGGFLMREAFELAYANAAVYCGDTPKLLHIDDILFRLPVDVGSMLFLSSRVVFTEGCHIQISTKASVFDVKKASADMTNIFRFTFQVPKPVPICLPHSYQDAMLYLDGRRRYQEVIGKKNAQT